MNKMRLAGIALMLAAAALLAVSPIAAGSDEKHHSEANHDEKDIWIGIYMHSDSDQRDGVHVLSVIDEGPADEAGMRDGDVIISLDGRAIRDVDEFSEEFDHLRPGDTLKVVVDRGGDERELLVTIGRRPAKQRYVTQFHFPDMEVLKDYRWPQARSRGYLGVELQELSGQLREFFGAPDDAGVLVSAVTDDSPAADAGLQAGDVIVEADGEEIEEARDLVHLMRDKEEGDAFEIVFLRDGAERRIEAISGVTEHKVWDVGPLVWCEDEEDCSFNLNFELGEGEGELRPVPFLQGMEQLQEYFHSPDVQHKLEEYYKQSEDFEEELRRKNEELERKLEELERRLEEIQERRSGPSGI